MRVFMVTALKLLPQGPGPAPGWEGPLEVRAAWLEFSQDCLIFTEHAVLSSPCSPCYSGPMVLGFHCLLFTTSSMVPGVGETACGFRGAGRWGDASWANGTTVSEGHQSDQQASERSPCGWSSTGIAVTKTKSPSPSLRGEASPA